MMIKVVRQSIRCHLNSIDWLWIKVLNILLLNELNIIGPVSNNL